jgi:hypothetical protein
MCHWHCPSHTTELTGSPLDVVGLDLGRDRGRPGNPQFPFPPFPNFPIWPWKRGGIPRRFPPRIRPDSESGIGKPPFPDSAPGRLSPEDSAGNGKRGPDWPQIGKSGILCRTFEYRDSRPRHWHDDWQASNAASEGCHLTASAQLVMSDKQTRTTMSHDTLPFVLLVVSSTMGGSFARPAQ